MRGPTIATLTALALVACSSGSSGGGTTTGYPGGDVMPIGGPPQQGPPTPSLSQPGDLCMMDLGGCGGTVVIDSGSTDAATDADSLSPLIDASADSSTPSADAPAADAFDEGTPIDAPTNE